MLSTLLKKAVEWNVIDQMPCVIKLLPAPQGTAAFHDFDECERLVTASREIGSDAELVVLIAGEAGLRLGEITALEWKDVDPAKRQLCVQRSEWQGPCNCSEGRAVAVCADDEPSHRCAEGSSPSSWSTNL